MGNTLKDRSGFTLHTWREKLAWIRKHGIKAYLTWATVDEAIGAPLSTSTIFWRWMFEHVLTWKYVYRKWTPFKHGDYVPWYMGCAWTNYSTLDVHVMVIPLNIIVGWIHRNLMLARNPWFMRFDENDALRDRYTHTFTWNAASLVSTCTCGLVLNDRDWHLMMRCPGFIDAVYRRLRPVIRNIDTNLSKAAERMRREGTEHVWVPSNVVTSDCEGEGHVWGAWYLPDEKVNPVKWFGESHRKCVRCNRVERSIAPGRVNLRLDPEYVHRLQAARDEHVFKREYEGNFSIAKDPVEVQVEEGIRKAHARLESQHIGTKGLFSMDDFELTGETRLPKCGEYYLEPDHQTVVCARWDYVNNEHPILRRKASKEDQASARSKLVWEEYSDKAFKLLSESTLEYPKRVVLSTDGKFGSVEHGAKRDLVFPECVIYWLDAPVSVLRG